MNPTNPLDPRTRTDRSHVVRREATIPARCTCGTPIKPGAREYTLTALPDSVESIFRGVSFCSPKCLRTFCLNSLETLDAIDLPSAPRIVTDLHELMVGVTTILVAVL